MSGQLDLDDVASTSDLAKAELAQLRADLAQREHDHAKAELALEALQLALSACLKQNKQYADERDAARNDANNNFMRILALEIELNDMRAKCEKLRDALKNLTVACIKADARDELSGLVDGSLLDTAINIIGRGVIRAELGATDETGIPKSEFDL